MSRKREACNWLILLFATLSTHPTQASVQSQRSTSEPLSVFLSLAEVNEAISTTLSSIEQQLTEQSCNEHAEKAAVIRAQAEYDSARSLQVASPSPANQRRMDQAQLALTVAQEQLGHAREFIGNLHQSLDKLSQQIAGNSEQIARLGLLVEREYVTGNRWLVDHGNDSSSNPSVAQEQGFTPSTSISAVRNPH